MKIHKYIQSTLFVTRLLPIYQVRSYRSNNSEEQCFPRQKGYHKALMIHFLLGTCRFGNGFLTKHWKTNLHNNLGTGYKRTGDQFTATPAIMLYVRQKGILRRGCDGLCPR